ncbi:MAG: ABC transporter permease [Gammaproteobacteria bacterium]|nr:ABC transporter permease [Gammaproteobacteria bacterium]
MRLLLLALRSLGREWRSGELAVLLAALTVAVAALSGVGFLVDRIGRAVQRQASEVLAADLRLESEAPLSAGAATAARDAGLATARLTILVSVVFRGDASQLANVRAVSSGYPLRGQLSTAADPFAPGSPAGGIPARGEVWPDSRLAATLGASVGDDLSVGALSLRVTRILISRPDQGSAFVEFAPALIMNDADLAATQLLQPGSRARHALLLAGDSAALQRFRDWYRARHTVGERLADVADSSPQIGDAALRAGRFLAVASLVAVLLTAIAVAMSARSYVRRHLDSVALLKTLGASRRFVLGHSLVQLCLLAGAATAAGATLGWLTQVWLLRALQGLLRTDLPAASALPALAGLAVAIAMLAGFALPSLLQLARVPALRVLRHDAGPAPLALWMALAPALATLVLVTRATLQEWPLSLWFLGGMLAALAVLAIAGALLVRTTRGLRGLATSAWRHALAGLARRRADSVAQIVAFGLGVLLLLLLAILRGDLLRDWRTRLPANAPNYFFVNIPTAERAAFRAQLLGEGARVERLLPMVRARLVAINGKAVSGTRFESERADGFAQREQNLTWAMELGEDNRVIAGRWWGPQDVGQPLVSVAEEFAAALRLQVGDRLEFDVAGERVAVHVASLRKVRWDSFRPNFFLVFPPGLLEGAAGTWMTSARFEPRTPGALAALVRAHPSVSVFNVGDLLAQVRAVVDKAAIAVQSVFLFTLAAGLTVLLAAVQASRDERRYEMTILRVLGAPRALLVRSLVIEFGALGLLAGVLAAAGAGVGGFLLARLLGLGYHYDPLLAALGVAGTVVLVATGGWLATRSVLERPPAGLLR